MKPFLKWAGGKSRLLPELEKRLPLDMVRRSYVEPFAGSGALFFHLADHPTLKPRHARLSDRLLSLMETYNAVRENASLVEAALDEFAEDYDGSQESYRFIRDDFNAKLGKVLEPKLAAIQAARFIFLNRAGFNGLYRTNKLGEFNVPKGDSKNPRPPKGALEACSEALEFVVLSTSDFATCASKASPTSFVYFDPPYLPAPKSGAFTGYARDGFGLEEHTRLARLCRALDLDAVPWMLSNSDTEAVRELWQGFNIEPVSARRSIAANGSRSSAGEVIIRNNLSSNGGHWP